MDSLKKPRTFCVADGGGDADGDDDVDDGGGDGENGSGGEIESGGRERGRAGFLRKKWLPPSFFSVLFSGLYAKLFLRALPSCTDINLFQVSHLCQPVRYLEGSPVLV